MRLLIDDGSRHTDLTGYGNLSRAITSSLLSHTDFEISFRFRRSNVPEWVPEKAMLDLVPVTKSESTVDCILRITAPPEKAISEQKPTLVYTQNALSDLIPEWVSSLRGVDGIVVPSEFDADVFRRYFSNVSVCHQYVDELTFKKRDRYRSEGPHQLSFLFVGSYSYRKGVDLLLTAFSKAFDDGRPVSLTLHCFTGLELGALSHLVNLARQLPSNIELSVFNGSVTPAWMSRIYNRHDCVLSFSRGEGWCMPLHEALLCEKPVIAPNSTAMGECLPNEACIKVETEEELISEVPDGFGGGIRAKYGSPGNKMYPINMDAAVDALREMYDNYENYARQGPNARGFIVKNYSKQSIASKIVTALNGL